MAQKVRFFSEFIPLNVGETAQEEVEVAKVLAMGGDILGITKVTEFAREGRKEIIWKIAYKVGGVPHFTTTKPVQQHNTPDKAAPGSVAFLIDLCLANGRSPEEFGIFYDTGNWALMGRDKEAKKKAVKHIKVDSAVVQEGIGLLYKKKPNHREYIDHDEH